MIAAGVGPTYCPRCRRLIRANVRGLCAACVRAEHAELATLRSYLRQHPNHTVAEASHDTGIEVRQILQWLREGRLEVSRLSEEVTCQRCGRSVVMGRLCPACRGQVAQAIVKVKKQSPPPAQPRPPAREQRERQPEDESAERFDLR